jgi:hypothetical protein
MPMPPQIHGGIGTKQAVGFPGGYLSGTDGNDTLAARADKRLGGWPRRGGKVFAAVRQSDPAGYATGRPV